MPWTYVINDINCKKNFVMFQEKELQKTNQKQFRVEKIIKRNGDKLYVKFKGYDDLIAEYIKRQYECVNIFLN